MLTTFENSQRLHQRREERERHLRAMKMYSKGLHEPGESALTEIVDALSGNPLEKKPRDSEEPEVHAAIPRCKYANLKLALLGTVGALLVAMTTFWLGVGVGQRDTVRKDIEPVGPVAADYHHRDRRNVISSLILDWGITKQDTLEDTNSAQYRAFNWLVREDSASMKAETIRTRYALASLYFSTQNVNDSSSSWTNDRHWLSSYPVCLWHGIECLDEMSTIGLVKKLNLSSNELHGTLPGEIGLLQLDIRSFDISKNNITGTLPNELTRMKNLGKH